MQLRVDEVRDEAQGIKSFRLVHPEGDELPSFEAGAHVEINVELPSGRAQRHYSLCSNPSDRKAYRIAVQLETAGGGGSRYMHEQVRAGDSLEVSEPRNAFTLAPEAAHSILMAGGIGITPILAMAKALEREGASYELHYAAKSADRMAFREELASANLYAGEPRMDLERILAESRPDAHVYVCGPRRLIEGVRLQAAEAGRRPKQIHFESFGARWTREDRPVVVELAQSGLEFEVPVGTPILDAMLEAGAWASYDCRRGECGMCVTTVLAGEPDHRDHCLPPAARENSMCTCVSWAQTPRLTLEI